MAKGDWIDIGGLWKQEGKAYLVSAKLKEDITIPKGKKIFLFPNKYKQEERHPDYLLIYPKQELQPQSQQAQEDDDIPF